MPDPKFQRGDLVRHRASGEVAVVVDANYYTEDGRDIYRTRADEEDLPVEFNGDYDLDLGFREDVVTVEEYLLERVESGQHSTSWMDLPPDITPEERELLMGDVADAVARAMVRWAARKAREAVEARGEEADRG